MSPGAEQTLIIWRFSDGKAGHDEQSRGLVAALQGLANCRSYDLGVSAGICLVGHSLLKRFPPGKNLPAPHVIVGAGHGTHLAMLCARRVRGGKILVLMKPSLPESWFDCCLIPAHDEPKKSAHIFTTQGALNSIRPADRLDKNRGLILIGGPSRHFHWNDTELKKQLQAIFAHADKPHADKPRSDKQWTITDSPRTPPATRLTLAALGDKRLHYQPYAACEPSWLQTQLQTAGTVWVSSDSMSMIYEALSAGGAVGILALQAKGDSHVVRATQKLIEQNKVTSFHAWENGAELTVNSAPLQEAMRCARHILATILAD